MLFPIVLILLHFSDDMPVVTSSISNEHDLNVIDRNRHNTTGSGSTENVQVIVANKNIPECINSSIELSCFEYSSNGDLHLSIGYNTSAITNYFISPDNATINYCASPSPQLKYCKLTRFDMDNYDINNHTLTADTGIVATLGDYYIDEEGYAFTCTDSILAQRTTPRCNQVKLNSDQYVILPNQSFFLKVSNTSIENATYQIRNDNSAILCYPLSIHFLNCRPTEKFIVLLPYTIVDSHLNLHLNFDDMHLNLGEYYYANNMGDAVVCPSEYFLLIGTWLAHIYMILYYISTACLIITFIVQLQTPKVNCYRKSFVNHIGCLAVYYMCGTKVRYNYGNDFNGTKLANRIVLTLYYFSLMSACFWLNVLAFHIYRSFSNINTLRNVQDRFVTTNHRFLYYSFYAYGIPSFLLCCLLVLEFSPTLQYMLSIYPYFYETHSYHDTATWYIFYIGPLLIVMGINFVFFLMTLYKIRQMSKWVDSIAQTGRQKQLPEVFIKLYIIMGLSITVEGIITALRNHIPFESWYISDAVFSLQGIAVFCTIVDRKKSFQLLRIKFDKVILYCKSRLHL